MALRHSRERKSLDKSGAFVAQRGCMEVHDPDPWWLLALPGHSVVNLEHTHTYPDFKQNLLQINSKVAEFKESGMDNIGRGGEGKGGAVTCLDTI